MITNYDNNDHQVKIPDWLDLNGPITEIIQREEQENMKSLCSKLSETLFD